VIPPVLLLHGFPLDARMWEAQRARLEQARYEVIAPNLPGWEPENEIARWSERILQLLSGPFVPVGCSMGGYVIFELWRQAAERIPAAAFVDTRATADTPEARQARQDTIRLLGEAGFDPFWEAQAPKLFGPTAPAEAVERARAIAAEQPIAGLVAALQALAARPDSRETAASMNVPALVLVGEDDALTPPSDSEELAGLLPLGRLVRLPGAGHLSPLERPDEVSEELLGFLHQVLSERD
jgi:pimeloyl-ACP methyl ester carboxylesterase